MSRRYLYSVYRTEDDELVAFDVDIQEAMKVMGVKRQTINRMMCKQDGVNGRWTLVRERCRRERNGRQEHYHYSGIEE